MRHGSLFSGIGGFDLAAEWMGWENVFQVEWDDYCQKVLTKNFPDVKRYGDITQFDGTEYRGAVDILSGGFPCQPFSTAGKRKGEADDRYLWPEYLRVIREIQPAYVVGENVDGLVSMDDGKTLEGIFTDLEGEGYQVESFIIPACGVGAWHRRDRIWIAAYLRHPEPQGRNEPERDHQTSSEKRIQEGCESSSSCGDVSNTAIQRLPDRRGPQMGERGAKPEFKRQNSSIRGDGQRGLRKRESRTWASESRMGGMVNGLSPWMDEPDIPRVATGVKNRVDRLKGLGNAIVPQVAYELFKVIEQL